MADEWSVVDGPASSLGAGGCVDEAVVVSCEELAERI